MRKVTILILGKLPPPYTGPAVATEIMLRSDLRNRYHLLHLNTNVHKTIASIGSWGGVKLLKNLGLYVRFVAMIARRRPDLVLIPISQSTIGFLKDSIFILVSRLLGRRTLLHLRGSNLKNWLKTSWPMTRFYVSSAIKITQGVIVVGDRLKYIFADYFNEKDIYVVHNGADFSYPGDARSSSSLSLLYLSNLQPSKGVEDVIGAVAYLKNTFNRSCRLDVVGQWYDADTENRCREMVRQDGLPVKFHNPASAEDKAVFFQNAGIFIFPPREPEGHPWVIIEAMAAGLPVISTDQGAITESVIDGVSGFIVGKQNPAQIAGKIRVLIENQDMRMRMGREGRRLYEEHFTEEKMVENLTHAFNSVLNRN